MRRAKLPRRWWSRELVVRWRQRRGLRPRRVAVRRRARMLFRNGHQARRWQAAAEWLRAAERPLRAARAGRRAALRAGRGFIPRA